MTIYELQLYSDFFRIFSRSLAIAALLFGFQLKQPIYAGWSISSGNDLLLDTSSVGFTVGELSGVTYLNEVSDDVHRFLAIQDNGDGLITFDATFDLDGNLVTAEAVSNQSLSTMMDFEGITRIDDDTIFLSEENGPGVREYNPTTGAEVQSVTIPSVITDNARSNLGFESLAYDGSSLWTGTESALAVDGNVATSAAGTTVRLLEIELDGSTPAATRQYAYEVDLVHDVGFSGESGLVELVAMPGGALLALERSFVVANFNPSFQNRIYEIDTSLGNEISDSSFDSGLTGQTYLHAGKGDLLYSSAVGGGSGQNLEGLTVGPMLNNGDLILLGVVDDGDPFSSNTIVSLIASEVADDTADFDMDGDTDGADFLAWQRNQGSGTTFAQGDATGNGIVNGADVDVWRRNFATATPPLTSLQAIPEPASLALLLLAGASSLVAISRRRR